MAAKYKVAVANRKGGVAKSTTALHMAHYGATMLGMRVVLAEFDTQRNASSCFPDSHFMEASELFDPVPADWVPPVWEGGPGVRVIVADDPIEAADSYIYELMQTGDCAALHYPREWLSKLDCDLIIMDTPPSAMFRLCAALVAAESVVTPFSMQGFSLDGIATLHQTIENMKVRHNQELRYLGILPTLVNSRSSAQQEALQELKQVMPGLVIPTPIMNRAAISDAMDNRRPVWVKPSGASGRDAAKEMKAACAAIFERVMK